jgi:Exopolysaccharide biosynthesis protein related to N-acetylglucosamine-1-phosphodiester alpha-N-acetylglucosaminidase
MERTGTCIGPQSRKRLITPSTGCLECRDLSCTILGQVSLIWSGKTGIVSAGPILVRDGRLSIDAATEGVVDPADLSFGYAWAEQRQPRTLAGTDSRGRLLLVTIDGREPGISEGATLQEAAELMRGLGAVNALNLDGGGSTAMAVNGAVVNKPSDATGERAVGDTVQVLP